MPLSQRECDELDAHDEHVAEQEADVAKLENGENPWLPIPIDAWTVTSEYRAEPLQNG